MAEEEKKVLTKSFTYELLMDNEDKDLFDRYTRDDDCRRLTHIAAIIMKRISVKPSKVDTVDHINRNPFDLRRINLRWCSRGEQNKNRRAFRNNTSGHSGVAKHVEKDKTYWRAIYNYQGEQRTLTRPFTEAGLLECCAFYQKVSGLKICPTCFPKVTEEPELESCLRKSFTYSVKFAPEHKKFLEKLTRPEDFRNIGVYCQQILSSIIPKPSKKHSVDHKNIDFWDCQPHNLRWLTKKEQMHNRRTFRNNTSGHQGVSYERAPKGRYIDHWLAEWRVDGRLFRERFDCTEQGKLEACKYYRTTMKELGYERECETCNKLLELKQKHEAEEKNTQSSKSETFLSQRVTETKITEFFKCIPKSD